MSSLIELLHPSGAPQVVLVFGGACPEEYTLCPQGRDRGGASADVVVVAPTREEGMDPVWLRQAIEEASHSLAPHGVLYVLADRRWRGRALSLLTECGLTVETVYIHHPAWPETKLLIPADLDTLTYAYSRLIHTNPARRRLALMALSAPGVLSAARRLLPQTGLVARRPGSLPSLNWLSGKGGRRRTIAQASWRGSDGAVLLHNFAEPAGRSTVAKAWLSEDGAGACAREVSGLQLAMATAGAAGAQVPMLLRHGDIQGRPYLVESVVAGEKASAALGRDPSRLPIVLAELAGWLAHWSARTARVHSFNEEDIKRFALAPARSLGAELRVGSGYEARLRELGERLMAGPARTVATHGDLTMVNVLVDEDGCIGVIDWEAASAQGLPLMDWFYAAVDAVAASEGYRDRLAAWEACFAPEGAQRELIAGLQRGLVEVMDLNQDQVAFSFHACWLHHALMERRETAKSAPDEFLRIAARAAAFLVGSSKSAEGP